MAAGAHEPERVAETFRSREMSAVTAVDLEETYHWLAGRPRELPTESFDLHAFASIFSLVLAETDWGRTAPLARALGLSFDQAVAAVGGYFPHALFEIGPVLGDERIDRRREEAGLLDLLAREVIDPGGAGAGFARILARRAQRPGALWQELGLRNRGELSTLMGRHFPALARRNARDHRWKIHLRRSLGLDPDPTICTALSCVECEDFFACFGEEDANSPAIPARAGAPMPRALSGI
jgi:nitrogen fixation protein NifQ